MPLSSSESLIATALAAIMVGRVEAMFPVPNIGLAGRLDAPDDASVSLAGAPTDESVSLAGAPTAVAISPPDSELDAVSNTLAASWAESTRRNYNRGITAYLVWCGTRNIPVQDRLPASESLLCEFGASFAGRYSGSAARNILSGVRAWHIFSNAPWMGGVRLQQVLHGVENLRPATSIKPLRRPVSINHLLTLRASCDVSNPLDAACFAAATTAFWCQNRLGELLPNTQRPRIPLKVPARSDLGAIMTAKGSRSLRLPWTKTTGSRGACVILCFQSGPSDPISSMENHLRINDVPLDLPLFSYNSSRVWTALSKKMLLNWCNAIWFVNGEPHVLSGHSFRIGGTTELLLRGIPPDVVRILGHWESDSFLAYWRDVESLAQVHLEGSRSAPGISGI